MYELFYLQLVLLCFLFTIELNSNGYILKAGVQPVVVIPMLTIRAKVKGKPLVMTFFSMSSFFTYGISLQAHPF